MDRFEPPKMSPDSCPDSRFCGQCPDSFKNYVQPYEYKGRTVSGQFEF